MNNKIHFTLNRSKTIVELFNIVIEIGQSKK